MTTIRELVERKEAAEAELAAVNAEIAARHGETDDALLADDGETDWEAMTKAELQAELDSRGIPHNSDDTKAELIDRLAE